MLRLKLPLAAVGRLSDAIKKVPTSPSSAVSDATPVDLAGLHLAGRSLVDCEPDNAHSKALVGVKELLGLKVKKAANATRLCEAAGLPRGAVSVNKIGEVPLGELLSAMQSSSDPEGKVVVVNQLNDDVVKSPKDFVKALKSALAAAQPASKGPKQQGKSGALEISLGLEIVNEDMAGEQSSVMVSQITSSSLTLLRSSEDEVWGLRLGKQGTLEECSAFGISVGKKETAAKQQELQRQVANLPSMVRAARPRIISVNGTLLVEAADILKAIRAARNTLALKFSTHPFADALDVLDGNVDQPHIVGENRSLMGSTTVRSLSSYTVELSRPDSASGWGLVVDPMACLTSTSVGVRYKFNKPSKSEGDGGDELLAKHPDDLEEQNRIKTEAFHRFVNGAAPRIWMVNGVPVANGAAIHEQLVESDALGSTLLTLTFDEPVFFTQRVADDRFAKGASVVLISGHDAVIRRHHRHVGYGLKPADGPTDLIRADPRFTPLNVTRKNDFLSRDLVAFLNVGWGQRVVSINGTELTGKKTVKELLDAATAASECMLTIRFAKAIPFTQNSSDAHTLFPDVLARRAEAKATGPTKTVNILPKYASLHGKKGSRTAAVVNLEPRAVTLVRQSTEDHWGIEVTNDALVSCLNSNLERVMFIDAKSELEAEAAAIAAFALRRRGAAKRNPSMMADGLALCLFKRLCDKNCGQLKIVKVNGNPTPTARAVVSAIDAAEKRLELVVDDGLIPQQLEQHLRASAETHAVADSEAVPAAKAPGKKASRRAVSRVVSKATRASRKGGMKVRSTGISKIQVKKSGTKKIKKTKLFKVKKAGKVKLAGKTTIRRVVKKKKRVASTSSKKKKVKVVVSRVVKKPSKPQRKKTSTVPDKIRKAAAKVTKKAAPSSPDVVFAEAPPQPPTQTPGVELVGAPSNVVLQARPETEPTGPPSTFYDLHLKGRRIVGCEPTSPFASLKVMFPVPGLPANPTLLAVVAHLEEKTSLGHLELTSLNRVQVRSDADAAQLVQLLLEGNVRASHELPRVEIRFMKYIKDGDDASDGTKTAAAVVPHKRTTPLPLRSIATLA